MLNYNEKILS